MAQREGRREEPPRVPRELSRALRRVRWSRRPALWLAAADSDRREQLSMAFRSLPKRFRVVRIPYGAIPAAEICAAALAELDRGLAGDPQAALLEVLAARPHRRERLVLAIEEADRMPIAEAVRLREVARSSGGALRLMVVTCGGPESERLRAVLTERGRGPSRPASRAVPEAPRSPQRLPPGESSDSQLMRRPSAGRAMPAAAPDPLAHPAAEQALAALEEGLRRGRRAVALQGPAGMGKTVLLHRLGDRLADAFEAVWVPCMTLSGEELLRWILYCRSGRDAPVDAGSAWRREVAGARTGPRGLLLLLDDAGALTPDAASELGRAIDCGEGCLRLAMTICDAAPRGAGEAFPDLLRVRLDTPLADLHAAALLRARFGQALDDAAIRRIVEEACGVPAALIRGASARLARRGDLAALLRRTGPRALSEPG